ncbi:molecular chaperone IbpA [Rhizobium sp. PP-CC-2G-626]|nr:molecular chaperone IbpA [Rhizobium sp. PP-CC-2G-626]
MVTGAEEGPATGLAIAAYGMTGQRTAIRCSNSEDTMRHVDFSPLYRSTVGFDRLFTMLDSLGQPDQSQSYPPYNIERTGDNTYRITMAVAGFDESELSIEAREHTLTVKGEKSEEQTAENQFLYRGIAKRAFERRFQLAEYMEIRSASLKNGLLHIDLLREIPEAAKPRRIEISAAQSASKQIEANQVEASVN